MKQRQVEGVEVPLRQVLVGGVLDILLVAIHACLTWFFSQDAPPPLLLEYNLHLLGCVGLRCRVALRGQVRCEC